jgi:hypothetical protein
LDPADASKTANGGCGVWVGVGRGVAVRRGAAVAAGVGEGVLVGVESLHELNKRPDKTIRKAKVNRRL